MGGPSGSLTRPNEEELSGNVGEGRVIITDGCCDDVWAGWGEGDAGTGLVTGGFSLPITRSDSISKALSLMSRLSPTVSAC